MMINGETEFLTLIGQPIQSVKAPMIYNPYFEAQKLNVLLLPMEVALDSFSSLIQGLFKVPNYRGSLITMPYKVAVVDLVDELSTTAKIAGACNAIKKTAAGKLVGEMFDGEGFVRGVLRKGLLLKGRAVLVIGSGGVGSAIAASLAAAGVAKLALYDAHADVVAALSDRLQKYYPRLQIVTGVNHPQGYDLVVNATPMGMKEEDLLPIDVSTLEASTFVGEVVMKNDMTPLLRAAQARGCQVQVGTDMLFEQIPAYLEFFDLPSCGTKFLREVAKIQYL